MMNESDDDFGIGRNLGLAHRARNSSELRVELAVQYTDVICANTGSRLSTQPLLSLTNRHWFDSVPELCQVKLTARQEPF